MAQPVLVLHLEVEVFRGEEEVAQLRPGGLTVELVPDEVAAPLVGQREA